MSAKSLIGQIIKRYARGLVLFLLLLVSGLMILFNGTPGVAKPQEIGLSVFSFFQGLISQSSHWVSQTSDSIVEMSNLKANYIEAKSKLEKYSGIERTVIELRDENKRLREQLTFNKSLEYPTVPAEVISRDITKVFSNFVINKGYLDGIRKNAPVIAYQDGNFGLVGKVIEVGFSSAIVEPIFDANFFVASRFQNTRYEGLISGKGNNEESLMMAYVSKKAKNELKIGDIVETSGQDSIYPKGFLIGRIKAINLKEYETTLNLEIEPILSYSKIEYVSVLRVD